INKWRKAWASRSAQWSATGPTQKRGCSRASALNSDRAAPPALRKPSSTSSMDTATLHEEDIFEGARRLTDRAARDAYLSRQCGNNHELRERIEGLLAAETE